MEQESRVYGSMGSTGGEHQCMSKTRHIIAINFYVGVAIVIRVEKAPSTVFNSIPTDNPMRTCHSDSAHLRLVNRGIVKITFNENVQNAQIADGAVLARIGIHACAVLLAGVGFTIGGVPQNTIRTPINYYVAAIADRDTTTATHSIS